jgi:7-keto-8-aminopelargonate synthetase-like enzyme
MGYPAQMNHFESYLEAQLEELRQQGLYRQLRQIDSAQSPSILLDGREVLNFSSNDYLGLANDPELKEAAVRAIQQYGTGAGASRLVCGSLFPHHELEETLAAFHGTERALSFSSGYAAALGTINALITKQDILVVDKLVHACVVDAARLSGATLRVFPHNDLDRLEALLQWADRRLAQPAIAPAAHPAAVTGGRPRVLVVTESVFSMDGDRAPLKEIVALKNRYGAWLMVDEAHATGLMGAKRRGLAEELGVGDHIEVHMGTLGKAVGAAGGYICGNRHLIDLLVNRARSFIFSTAPAPAAAAAASAGLRLIQSDAGAERCSKLWLNRQFLTDLIQLTPAAKGSAILPFIIGSETEAVAASSRLREQGLLIPAIRYPTVARGRARLRLTLTAAHTASDLQRLATALDELRLASPAESR